jgi:hypothetical protein
LDVEFGEKTEASWSATFVSPDVMYLSAIIRPAMMPTNLKVQNKQKRQGSVESPAQPSIPRVEDQAKKSKQRRGGELRTSLLHMLPSCIGIKPLSLPNLVSKLVGQPREVKIFQVNEKSPKWCSNLIQNVGAWMRKDLNAGC